MLFKKFFGEQRNFDKAKDKKPLRYSFIIAPNMQGEAKTFSISAFWLRLVMLFGGLFIVASVLVMISYVGLSANYSASKTDLSTLKSINKQQQEELYNMNELAKDVEQQLLYLQLLETKINTMIDDAQKEDDSKAKSESASPELNEVNANVKRLEQTIELAKGGQSDVSANYFIDSDPISDYDLSDTIYRINTVLSSIDIDIEDESSKVEEIKETIEAKDDYLECHPDFLPIAKGHYNISDYFGYRTDPYVGFHAGLDMSAPYGTSVMAAGRGTVIKAGYQSSYGNCIIVNHGYGLKTLYAHLSKILVKVGTKVEKGDLIGRVGSTGYSTGNHLHFEVHENGTKVNPQKYINP